MNARQLSSRRLLLFLSMLFLLVTGLSFIIVAIISTEIVLLIVCSLRRFHTFFFLVKIVQFVLLATELFSLLLHCFAADCLFKKLQHLSGVCVWVCDDNDPTPIDIVCVLILLCQTGQMILTVRFILLENCLCIGMRRTTHSTGVCACKLCFPLRVYTAPWIVFMVSWWSFILFSIDGAASHSNLVLLFFLSLDFIWNSITTSCCLSNHNLPVRSIFSE